jgi:hypothetical protein
VFGHRVQRGIFGRKVEEVRDGWNKLHIGGQQDFFSVAKISRIIKGELDWRCK